MIDALEEKKELSYEEVWCILRSDLEKEGFRNGELEKILDIVDHFLEKHLFDLE